MMRALFWEVLYVIGVFIAAQWIAIFAVWALGIGD